MNLCITIIGQVIHCVVYTTLEYVVHLRWAYKYIRSMVCAGCAAVLVGINQREVGPVVADELSLQVAWYLGYSLSQSEVFGDFVGGHVCLRRAPCVISGATGTHVEFYRLYQTDDGVLVVGFVIA